MSSPFRIDEVYIKKIPISKKSSQLLEDWSRTMHDVVSLMRTSKEALAEMFDRFTVAEWIEQKLYPMYSRLSKLRQTADGLRGVSVWPSRPYEPLEALKGLGIGVEPTVESKVHGRKPEHKLKRWDGVKKERRVRENEVETEVPPKRRVQAPDYYSSRRKQL